MDSLLEIAVSNAVAASLLALAAGAAGHFCRRPALTHGLWLLVLLKLVTPPLVSIPLPWPAPAEVPSRASPEAAARSITPAPVDETDRDDAGIVLLLNPEILTLLPEEQVPAEPAPEPTRPEVAELGFLPITWQTVVLAIWLTGSAGWLALALVRTWRFHRLLRHARPAPPGLREQAARLARRLGLDRCPRVWLVPGRISPMLWALGRPCLLLPADLLQRLSPEQQATLLAHELAHLRRRDYWIRILELLATGLYWWLPVVWWARRELREAEEQCCDAWVVWALPGTGRLYATALLDTLDFLSESRVVVPVAASGIGTVHDLKRRLTMIMRGTTPRSLTWAGCLALLALGGLLLPLVPTWAQTEPIQKEVEERLKAERARRAADEGRDRAGQLEQARHEVKKFATMLEQLQLQMREVQAAHKQAQDRLAQFEGRGVRGEKIERSEKSEKIIIMIQEADGTVRKIEVPPGAELLKKFDFEIKPGQPPRRHTPPAPPTPPGVGVLRRVEEARPAAGSSDARLRDLERKIEALLKEMEALRRDMRPARPGGGGAPPADGEVFYFLRSGGPDQLRYNRPAATPGIRVPVPAPERP